MKVLVTGGAGYIGSAVTRALLGAGHQVTVLDCLRYGAHGLIGLYLEDGFRFRHGDVRSAADVGAAMAGMDAVVHLAAIVGDPACARQPELARQTNLEASLQLIDLARAAAVRQFVFASTCSNYGKMDGDGFLTEDSELRPVSLYAETKVAVERELLKGGGGLTTTVLRFATVFGLSARMRFDLTVNEFTMELLTHGRLVVYGEQFWRPYVHVRDAARAVARVLEAPPASVAGRVYNVGDSAENYQKKQLVELVRAELGSGDVEYVQRLEDPRDYRVSFARVASELGFQVTRRVPDGIREVADALRQGVIADPDDPRYRN